ncbi:YajQ family cyclic di-GMP-binding protein [Aliikangiella sp. G2MR2-5]|uniref:YajQ family cyclic di-GMP-binding protein n=1 Tax=Aliikangiella sp. G2MR2-5 TaxID=2788943 RepID=UPI0018A91C97|nr:YajQ family cyclic di-GMP-binding protein [Aliikangiella sp. G2MR2-5]
MPSFDIVSEIDKHELSNAVDQSNREISTRFDLKGTPAKLELADLTVTVTGEGEFQAKQVIDIFRNKLVKRGLDPNCMDVAEADITGKIAKQSIIIREGIEQALAKKVVKCIKDSKMKVQASIQGDKVRVTGKKRDDLQSAIAVIKEAEFEWPLQFNNFRD